MTATHSNQTLHIKAVLTGADETNSYSASSCGLRSTCAPRFLFWTDAAAPEFPVSYLPLCLTLSVVNELAQN